MFVLVWSIFATKYKVIKTTGSLESAENYFITAEYEGIIKYINFEEGDYVNQGDVIIELDSKFLDLEREKINHEITRIESEISNYLLFKESISNLSNQFSKNTNEYFFNKVNLLLDEYKNIEHTKDHSNDKIKDTEKSKLKITKELDECIKSIEKNNSNLKENETHIDALREEILTANNLLVEKQALLANENDDLIKEQYTNQIVQVKQDIVSLQNSLNETLILNQQYEGLKLSLKNRKLQLENQEESVVNSLEEFDESIEHVDTQMEMFLKTKIIEAEDEIERLEHELIDFQFSREKLNLTQNSVLIKANKSGVIHFSEEISIGQLLTKGTSFAEMTDTSSELVYVCYVTSLDRIMIDEGLSVNISLPGEFKNKYGSNSSGITKISVKPLKQSVSGGELFKVTALIESNELSNETEHIKLSAGLVVNGEIIYEESSWFDWMLEQLNIN